MTVMTGGRGFKLSLVSSFATSSTISSSRETTLTTPLNDSASVVAVGTSSAWLILAKTPRSSRFFKSSLARTSSFSASSRIVMPSVIVTSRGGRIGCPGRGPLEREPCDVSGKGPRLPVGTGPRFPVGNGRAEAPGLAGAPGRPGAAAAGRMAEGCLPDGAADRAGTAGRAAAGVAGAPAGAGGRIGVAAGAVVAGAGFAAGGNTAGTGAGALGATGAAAAAASGAIGFATGEAGTAGALGFA